jgi:hypothetical protein
VIRVEVAEVIAVGAAKVIGLEGGQRDRRNWPDHATLGDQGAAKLMARGGRVAVSVGARP